MVAGMHAALIKWDPSFSGLFSLLVLFLLLAGCKTPSVLVTEEQQTGDRYHWTYVHDFAHGGTFERVEPGRLVRFTFGSMMVNVHFRELGEVTEVDLHQTGCATADPERAWQHVNCRSCWIFFMTNLRSILAQGPDLRDHEHPNWNDSVSIGFDPAAGPGQPR